ncbi:MAG: UDP-N-acetylmuramoyl-tripeptide--D-alanyl-D-alanine ligase [Chlorobi bacterium]|nr:UDP-N-acetylmuramoyl-tripeptide--D-alanyl-D-alanine ligase [Chlorobiota bacterium]
MARFTAEELLAAIEPVITDNPNDVCVEGVSTDTRTLQPGELFIALRGDCFDGHDFVETAIKRGARALVLDLTRRGSIDTHGVPTLWVHSTLDALGMLARYHRRRCSIPVIAVAGSVGKTTTKDMAAHILSERYVVHKTPGNWNNAIGVPLVLLGIAPHHTAAVVELGTNHPGEIAALCRIAKPTHGVITAVAEEHLEFLGDLDGVEREETALFNWLSTSGGIACVNLDDERLRHYAAVLPAAVTFGTVENAAVRATVHFEADTLFPLVTIDVGTQQAIARVQQPGYAAAQCAIAAAAIAASVGLDPRTIATALSSYLPERGHGYGRMIVQCTCSGIVILNDCYNANPASMRSALDTLAAYPTAGRRIALLGDMRELGAATAPAHRAIVRYAAERADVIIAIGEAMGHALDRIPSTYHARTHTDAALLVRQFAQGGDVLLVKGSRSLRLETVIAMLDAP